MNSEILEHYGGRIRVRVCGVLIENEHILLAKHEGIGDKDILWIPPGGGLEVGETIVECLTREFEEETNLVVEVGDFLCANEFINGSLHALELFFIVKRKSGMLKMGIDPEFSEESQIIKEVRMMSFKELPEVDSECLHWVVRNSRNSAELFNRQGLFNFQNNA